ncbi:hypothetical protein HNQ60_001550 [Povalibacter uvarum]|uniref:DUF3617 domain-containing protein n=1 Tax=Povalibacter uvarum TaxID=732238 RepID=A0A841HKM2_9GAMM|nr:DUF3617 domain-containing protein [Povalibacter uvarum]MBB6092672.1 hypothetical protein [Povalibacter uvarum]
MTRSFMTRNLLIVAFACVLAPALVSSAEKLNVKTGLWETKSSLQFSGMPVPKELRQKLTPEQLAKMRADLAAEAAKGPIRETSRDCITAKDLENPFASSNTKDCKQTIVNTTRTSQEARLVCEGDYKGTGVLKIQAPTPETMNGTLDIKMSDGTETFTMKGTLSGRWVSADCGDEDEGDVDQDEEPADDEEEEE